MAKLGKYDVEIEFLDEDGNVWDSSCVLLTDDEAEAMRVAYETELSNPNEQVAIWIWDDDEENVLDSYIVKQYEDCVA